ADKTGPSGQGALPGWIDYDSMFRSPNSAAAVVAVCLALISCSKQHDGPQALPEPLCRGCNVVLISMDTVRRDHLGAYGYTRNTSPNFDRLASRAVIFDDAVSQSAWTLPAHGSMMTGLYPGRLGVTHYPAQRRLPDLTPMLAEKFKRAGYATGGFTGGGFVSAHFGFSRGFDVYTSDGRRFEHNIDEAFTWLNENKRRRFFLFFHGYDAHRPYYSTATDKAAVGIAGTKGGPIKGYCTPENRKRPEDLEAIIALYDAAIHHGDQQVGRLLEALEKHGLMANTVVVITSDHGEEFFEHGNCDHVRSLYHETLSVPYVVYVPGLTPTGLHISDLVPASLSVASTLLDLVGIGHDMPGVSLEPMLHAKRGLFEAVYSETSSVVGNLGSRGETIAMTTKAYKLILYTEEHSEEAYDRIRDRDEQRILAKSSSAYLGRAALEAWHRSLTALPRPYSPPAAVGSSAHKSRPPVASKDEMELPKKLGENLRSLGYLD
ncbi:MAG: sulfatase, partial [Candidatus Binatia bacterium]